MTFSVKNRRESSIVNGGIPPQVRVNVSTCHNTASKEKEGRLNRKIKFVKHVMFKLLNL